MAEDKMGLLLIGKPRKEEGDTSSDGKISASKAALKAIKAGDAEALNEALTLHYELCAGEKDYEPESEEEE